MEHYTPSPLAGGVGTAEIIRALWGQRILVAFVAVTIAGLALAYAMLVQPIFRATTVLQPVSIAQLESLGRSGLYDLTPSSALSRIASALDSYEARSGYFKEWVASHPSSADNQDIDKMFLKYDKALDVTVSDVAKSPRPQVVVAFDYAKGVAGADYLNGYVNYVLGREAAVINREIKSIIAERLSEAELTLGTARAAYQVSKASRIAQLRENDDIRRAQLNDELKALRQQLKIARQDRIALLGEAEGIARSLGIQKLVTPSSLAQLSGSGNVIRAELNYNQNPLYFMGVEALQAERNALASRKSDDFTEPRIAQIVKELAMLSSNREAQAIAERVDADLFIVDAEASRRELARLQALKKSIEIGVIAKVDRPAFISDEPVKPNRFAIITMGVIFGVVIGLLVALVRFFMMQASRVGQSGLLRSPTATLVQAASGAALLRD